MSSFKLLTILYIICNWTGIKASSSEFKFDSFPTTIIDSSFIKYCRIYKLPFLYDKNSQIDIVRATQATGDEFTQWASDIDTLYAKGHIWSRFRVMNNSGRYRVLNFTYNNMFDTVWVYEINDGKASLLDITGRYFSQKERITELPSLQTPFTLRKGETKEYLIKLSCEKSKPFNQEGYYIYIYEQNELLNYWTQRLRPQHFFTGIYLVFIIMSLVMFFSFKERVFIYFSLIMFFSALYFLNLKGVLLLYFGVEQIEPTFSRFSIILTGLMLSIGLFSNKYLGYKKSMPRLLKVNVFVLILFILFVLFGESIFSSNKNLGYVTQNLVLIIWVSLTIAAAVILIRKGEKAPKIFLTSIITLALFTIIDALKYLVDLNYAWTRDGIQYGFLVFSSVLFYGLFDKITLIQKDRALQKVEKEKSDELLFNILPAEIAQELKDKGKSEARHYDNVSTLFTDFKSFTEIAEQMTPAELVGEINHCFKYFDSICKKYNVEKIKTIGDSYMAASGLTNKSAVESQQSIVDTSNTIGHVPSTKNVVLAALEMQEFMNSRNKELQAQNSKGFEMRAGIHSGPAVAGVVGDIKFQYDIWGDSVNTASRMESHGEIGKVNISETTYHLIKDDPDFSFVERGELEVKGKGKKRMFFVALKN